MALMSLRFDVNIYNVLINITRYNDNAIIYIIYQVIKFQPNEHKL